MSTNKKITMRNHNGTDWDVLYPKTLAEQVIVDQSKQFVSDTEKATWSGKAEAIHSHEISDVTGLQTALDGKSAVGHTHTLSNITDAGTAASKDVGVATGNVPIIGSDGKLDTSIMPAIAISDTFVVASQTAMLALTAEVGDIAVRTDLSKSFILKATPASTLANWQELLTPSDTVTSVAGKTGVVTLTSADVGLGNVTNESKTTMFTSPVLTGTPTAPTAEAGTSTTQLATTEFVTTAIDSKTDITGNAGTATKLQTGRTITLSGDVTGSVSFDGSTDVSITATIADDSHSHSIDTITGLQGELDVKAPLASPALTGTPTAPTAVAGTSTTQLATTEFVSDAVGELSSTYKKSVKVATTANITLSGAQTIDGVTLVAGDRVLVKSQTIASQNGIYVVGSGVWVRSTDADTSADIASSTVAVDSGTVNGGLLFDTDFKSTDTIGTTSVNWSAIADSAKKLNFFSSTTSAELAEVISDETGTGSLVFANSPALIGTPTAPTAAAGTNTTQLATTAFVNAAISGGSSSTAAKLSTARTIALSGDVTGSVSFDGSSDVSITATIADDSHNHTIENVDGLQTALDGKSDVGHNHTLSDITDAGTAASKDVGTASGNVPILDANGKLDQTILPAIAISDTFVIASQTAMLALTAEVGDIAVRTDLSKSFILKATPASTLANWQELLTPSDTVTSVAGKTGAVTLTASDVGLGNVTNESKTTMFTSPALTGTPTAPTATAGTSTTQLATTAFVATAVANKIDITGNAGTATKLATARTISLTGDVSGSATFDGSANASITVTVADDSHNHTIENVDGLQTALDAKAPLASPALTGTPTAPTATAGTNTTQVATTAFVQSTVETAVAAVPKFVVSDVQPTNASVGDFWYEVV